MVINGLCLDQKQSLEMVLSETDLHRETLWKTLGNAVTCCLVYRRGGWVSSVFPKGGNYAIRIQ